jgi:hypothetical protein
MRIKDCGWKIVSLLELGLAFVSTVKPDSRKDTIERVLAAAGLEKGKKGLLALASERRDA